MKTTISSQGITTITIEEIFTVPNGTMEEIREAGRHAKVIMQKKLISELMNGGYIKREVEKVAKKTMVARLSIRLGSKEEEDA